MGLEIYVSPIMREWIVKQLEGIETINDEPILNSVYKYIQCGVNPLEALIDAVKAFSEDRMRLIKQIVEFESKRAPAPIILECKLDPDGIPWGQSPIAQMIRNKQLNDILADQEQQERIAAERRKRGIFD